MKSLRMNEEQKKDFYAPEMVKDKAEYPHGLTLHLSPETLKKLDIGKTPQAGDIFKMLAKVKVTAIKEENEVGDAKEYSVELQVTDMELGEKETQGDRADSFYKE